MHGRQRSDCDAAMLIPRRLQRLCPGDSSDSHQFCSSP